MEVRIENLVKVFQGKKGEKTVAVNNMTFDIPDGKLCGLLGPSGCGKSTTLYMIAGLHNITEGKIYFGEEDVTHVPAENRGIGLVFQNYALYPHFNVRQNIMFPLDNVRPKLSYDEKCAIVLENAKIVDIDKYLDRKPKELSGGQQQRVAIARALAKRPRVLLLDEPLSNLDARLRLQTREEIKRIQKNTGITTVFVTHDQEEAMSISDFIVVMKDGIVQQKDEPQRVYEEPANLFVAKFLGTPAINVFDGVISNGLLTIAGNKLCDDKALKNVHIEEITCPNCGSIVPHNAKYCNICGENLLNEGEGINKKHTKHVSTEPVLNLNKSLVVNKSGDKKADNYRKLYKKIFRDTDNQEIIDLFAQDVESIHDEETFNVAVTKVNKTRAINSIRAINVTAQDVKEVLDANVAEIEGLTKVVEKEEVSYVDSLVRRSHNVEKIKPYADKIRQLYSESDWEATKRIKESQIEVIYGMRDVESQASIDKINSIIESLGKRLNPERTCKIGIRPESFKLSKNGPIKVRVQNIEHIGRDISVIGHIDTLESNKVKIIIPAELAEECEGKELLSFEPKRIYVFEESGERII